jgi:hypothetical protein
MSWIDKIFGTRHHDQEDHKDKKVTSDSATAYNPLADLAHIRFGAYSDNNKSYTKTQNWHRAEDLFKQAKYGESFFALFEYFRDDVEDNVHFHQVEDGFTFDLMQGGVKVFGTCSANQIVVSAKIVVMDEPNVAVMRQLLDMNFNMYYSRTALDEHNVVYLIFDTDVASANPNKLYYALKELAIKADKKSDLLMKDFPLLKPADTTLLQRLSDQELNVKYSFFKKWIDTVLAESEKLNQDSFAGAIAYLYLDLIYRIHFFFVPRSGLLFDLEKIHSYYWDKMEELPLVERNKMMRDGIKKIADYTSAQFADSVCAYRATFAVNTPTTTEKMREAMNTALKDARWYMENKYEEIAITLLEYSLLYNQYAYSVPRVITNLTIVLSAVLHPEYFAQIGMRHTFYSGTGNSVSSDVVKKAVDDAIAPYLDKYTNMRWDHSKLEYDSLFDFTSSFVEQIANLNLETKRP